MTEDTLCRECRNPLPAGAIKCTACSAYQNWRRLVFTWSGLFTALLALVPLWSGAFSLRKLAFPKPADVHVGVASCKASGIDLYVTNLGEVPAMLGQPKLQFLEQGKWSAFDSEFPMDEDDLVSEPAEIDVVRLSPPDQGEFPSPGGKCSFKIAIPVASGNARSSSAEAACDCVG